MTNTLVTIEHDTNRNSRDPHGYKITFRATENPGRTFTSGSVINNIRRYAGVFETEQAAVSAALAYIDTPCAILELIDVLDPDGRKLFRVVPQGSADALPSGYRVRVMGANSAHGLFIAN